MTDLFADVYVITTGVKQRVPREWLDDPILGLPFRKTPSQRELDGELGPRPNTDSTAKDIDAWAAVAEVDLSGVKTKDAKLVAIEAVFGPASVQAGLLNIEPPALVLDPLAPELVAHVDDPSGAAAADDSTTSTGGTTSSDDTPAAGDKEN